MKYYIWILGCAMNHSDAERLSAVLDSLGYTRTFNETEANLFIVISCSVRQSAINRIYGKVRDLNNYKKEKKLVTLLSGCVLKEDREKLSKVFDILFEIKDLEILPQLLSPHFEFISESQEILKQVQDDKAKSGEYLSIIPHYESNFRAYVPISTGCNNFCTYCAVPYTRGREKSRPIDEIVSEVKDLVEKGYKEITLLGQNVNSYGQDLEKNGDKNNRLFIQLLTEIDKIQGNYRIYFYSNHPKDMTDELIDILPTLVHFPQYIHLPLQSGNNEIIQKMNRHYSKNEYLNLVEKIRTKMPNVALTTDIIVGFPTETPEQFNDTKEVMKKAEFDMAFIAQYSPRSGTISAKMTDDVSKEEKRQREDVLQEILAKTAIKNNEKLVDTTQKVLIDGNKDGKFYGRTEGYKVVEIKTDQILEIGQFIEVKIISTTAWKLSGEL